jgi:hypothetical protein
LAPIVSASPHDFGGKQGGQFRGGANINRYILKLFQNERPPFVSLKCLCITVPHYTPGLKVLTTDKHYLEVAQILTEYVEAGYFCILEASGPSAEEGPLIFGDVNLSDQRLI